MLIKTMYNRNNYTDSDYKKKLLLRLRLYYTPADIQMLCLCMCAMYFYQIILKRPGLSVVSGLHNVLRDRQGRLIR